MTARTISTLREVHWTANPTSGAGRNDQLIRSYYASRGATETDLVQRICLRCDQPFTAAGKFQRLCPTCRGSGEGGVRTGRIAQARCRKELSR